MKLLFYDTKPYDREFFNLEIAQYPDIDITYVKGDLAPRSAVMAEGYDGVCAFVNSNLCKETLEVLASHRIHLILMRCAGFNNINLDAAKNLGIKIYRVPGYSPEAVAEHAMMLALAANRHVQKSYLRVRENDFSLSGLLGFNFYKKTAGIIGTGKIGAAMAQLCYGFGMKVLGFDLYPNASLPFVNYVSLDTLLAESDLISLHCPLTKENHHLINQSSIRKMKDGVVFVNTSRGGLVNTEDLIEGIRARKFFAVGLDVYEEEAQNVFVDRSDEILEDSVTARLLSFPNVIITSHQGFFTREALQAISQVTLENAMAYQNDTSSDNRIV